MVKIVTDTSTLYTIEEGKALNIRVIPLCVSIFDKHLRDLCFDTKEFLQDIKKGGIPTTSQPPVGDVVEAYDEFQDDDILNICMADGLSGTYQTALMAREQAIDKERIIVLNSTTLCGPHRYLVQKAIKLRDEGKNIHEIVDGLKDSLNHIHSFLLPQDFSFLKRGGRLKPAAANIGGFLKLKPIMQAVDNGTRLDKFTITRTLSKAIDVMMKRFEDDNVDENYKIYVTHADALEDANFVLNKLKAKFHKSDFELLDLSPAFITQGGPECIAVQYIKK